MKKRTVTLIAAAVLAAAPIAGVTASNIGPQVVEADAGTPDSNAIILRASLKKKTLHFGSPDDIDSNTVGKDVRVNHGNLPADDQDADIKFFLRKKNGAVDWSNEVYDLKNGDRGVMIYTFNVENLRDEARYTFLSNTDDSGTLVWTSDETYDGTFINDRFPAIEIPFTIGKPKPKRTKKAKPKKPSRRRVHKHRTRRNRKRHSRRTKRSRRSRRHVRRHRRHARRR